MSGLPPLKKQFMDLEMAEISGSKFNHVLAEKLHFHNVNLSGTKITDANLSDLHIEDAQIGGATFRHIGLPPEGHPAHDSDAKHRTVTFENCDLNTSTLKNCNLSNVDISNCSIKGLRINGVLIEELLEKHVRNSD
ncbi:pentapeptide repeat-containing protein [Virgibacillus ndiopensis]|uniref:pentapeptide repeat-containing protein n=1 Tax=Virgibacillus ndiopensis TaxID=2004408 RepID=UPI000C07C36E|nr:pentapeptide repeat-containing protein [Virgibacillus ndiopensis]